MLAYSSIAHAGYLLTTCVVVGADRSSVSGTVGQEAIQAIVFYFLLYVCMNLGAFFIVTLMRRDTGSTQLSSLRGAARKQPFLAICFAIILFSLTGLPPTAGFLGKFLLFAPVIKQGFYVLAIIGLLNGAVSLYYYALPIKEMFFTEPDGEPRRALQPGKADLVLVAGLTAPLIFLVIKGWSGLMEVAGHAVALVR